jgi:linoleoyl-CoA desaturase
MWNIYGKKYDLSPWMDSHPGGRAILEQTRGLNDCTALFETYHAFSNRFYMLSQLEKYQVKDTAFVPYEYKFDTYHKLVDRIKKIYPSRQFIKSSSSWFYYVLTMLACYSTTFYVAMNHDYSMLYRCISAFIAAIAWLSLAFNVMHDGSHYAISTDAYTNQLCTRMWNQWGLWNSLIWFYHHIYHHHSFTGEENKDPDVYHFRPFIRKTKHDKIHPFFITYQPYVLAVTAFVFPGQYIGQVISYIRASIKKRLFSITIPNLTYYHVIDIIIYLLSLYTLSYGLDGPTYLYILTLNTFYHINTELDHDTYETMTYHTTSKDWLHIQVNHSNNFMNQDKIYTRLFGGINYQIEHHLFPNMCNEHYATIQPIVEQFCKENNLPYHHHPTLLGAYSSFLKKLKYMK